MMALLINDYKLQMANLDKNIQQMQSSLNPLHSHTKFDEYEQKLKHYLKVFKKKKHPS